MKKNRYKKVKPEAQAQIMYQEVRLHKRGPKYKEIEGILGVNAPSHKIKKDSSYPKKQ